MKKNFPIILLAVVTPVSLRFFDAHFLDERLVNYLFFLLNWSLFLWAIILSPVAKGPFNFPLKLILFGILFSILMAYYSWDQSIWNSFIEYPQYLIWSFFFVLLGLNVPIKVIEKVVIFYGLAYAALYFYQYINSGTILFGKSLWGDEFIEQRGTIRIIFPGKGVFLLTIFISITKITSSESKNKWFWIIIAALGLVIPIMQVTRQYILGVMLIYVFHFSKATSNIKKILFLLVFSLSLMVLVQSELPMIKGLINTQKESDTRVDKNYIRVLAAKYFLTDFTPNKWSYIFGNGSPYWGESAYGKFIESLADRQYYFISDLGLIGVYTMFGIFAITGYILMWIKSITVPIPAKYNYAKYYLWYLFITGLTGASTYYYHYLITTVFSLYIFQKSYLDESKKRKIINMIKTLEKKKNTTVI